MQAAIEQFRANIARVRDLGAIYSSLRSQTTPAMDLTDILRAEMVLAVSAFDHYIHDVTRMGMQEIYQGTRPHTPAFLRFNVSLENVLQGMADPTSTDWLENEIRTQHGWRSFQHADNVADAIRLVSGKSLWAELAGMLGQSPREVKEELNLIVDRRNKIAHEADMDPTFPWSRWQIDEALVEHAVAFLESVAETLYRLLQDS